MGVNCNLYSKMPRHKAPSDIIITGNWSLKHPLQPPLTLTSINHYLSLLSTSHQSTNFPRLPDSHPLNQHLPVNSRLMSIKNIPRPEQDQSIISPRLIKPIPPLNQHLPVNSRLTSIKNIPRPKRDQSIISPCLI